MAKSIEPVAADRNPLLTFPVMGQVYSLHWSEFPFDNLVNCVRKVIKHKLGNETYTAAMNVVAEEAGLEKDMSKDDRSETFKTWREANPDRWREAFIAECDKMWEVCRTEGGIGETDRPRTDPVEREYYILLDKAIAETFKGAKDSDGKAFKVPTNDTDAITFPDGEKWTRAELRDAIASQPGSVEGTTRGDELREQAIDIVEAKKLKPTTTAPTVEAVSSASQFGLVKKAAA